MLPIPGTASVQHLEENVAAADLSSTLRSSIAWPPRPDLRSHSAGN